jgi:hypothetical protein
VGPVIYSFSIFDGLHDRKMALLYVFVKNLFQIFIKLSEIFGIFFIKNRFWLFFFGSLRGLVEKWHYTIVSFFKYFENYLKFRVLQIFILGIFFWGIWCILLFCSQVRSGFWIFLKINCLRVL